MIQSALYLIVIFYNNWTPRAMMIKEKMKFQIICDFLKENGYKMLKLIGSGAFAEVFLVQNREKKPFAAKVISRETFRKKPFLQRYLQQEVKIMEKLNHPNVIQHHQFLKSNSFAVIVMEYCERGNLLKYQSKLPYKSLPLEAAVEVMTQVLRGLQAIHDLNYIHRDIKAENILLGGEAAGRSNLKGVCFKIADFGFARPTNSGASKTLCGTQKYMAPEIMSNTDGYGPQVDVWALGVLLYFMIFAEYPFRGYKLLEEIRDKCTPQFSLPLHIRKKSPSPHLQNFFSKVFVVNPAKRCTLRQLYQHPLIGGTQKDVLSLTESIRRQQIQEKKDNHIVIEMVKIDGIEEEEENSEAEPEDETRIGLLKKEEINPNQKHLRRELEEINFEVERVMYLKDSIKEIFESYKDILDYPQRLAARYYLLKVYQIFAEPLASSLDKLNIPASMGEADITQKAWIECTLTEYYQNMLEKLKYCNMQLQSSYEDTYNYVCRIKHEITVPNFQKSLRLEIETSFDDVKLAYRSMTSYLFKKIHETDKLTNRQKNKMKMRVFCCHAINRIFKRSSINNHFPQFSDYLKQNKIEYPQFFDFYHWKKWMTQETEEKLHQSVEYLRKMYF